MNAQKILKKASEYSRPVYAFLLNGAVKVLVQSDRAERMCDEFPKTLIGVYDATCKPKWIADDLKYMGAKP